MVCSFDGSVDLDLILVGLFQLRVFYNSMINNSFEVTGKLPLI